MAPLQKRALYGLVIGICLAGAILALFLLKGGVSRFEADQGFRLLIDVLWIAGLVTPIVLFWPITRNSVKFDERDKNMMDRSGRVQWLAIVLSLAAWLVILSEAYHAQGMVPVTFLYIMFISILVVSTIAQSLGMLISYWRMDRNA